MSHLSGYTEQIVIACLLFLPTAALFTLPFMVFQYRKYGSIPFLRVLVVYAFILYMMCAFLLTVLPLPTEEKLAALPDLQIQLIPFGTYLKMFRNAGFSLSDLGSFLDLAVWKKLIQSSNLFEILANIVMQVPLGVFLRYYFRRSWKQVLLIGFCVSLFYELTQLSGLFFIYSKPYRLCSVDDLFDNTLGAMIGYAITPILCAFLPTREKLDEISIARARKITWVRRITSAVLDWVVYAAVIAAFICWFPSDSGIVAEFLLLSYPLWVVLIFVVGQKLFKGRTPGKFLLRLRLVDLETPGQLHFRHLLIRYCYIYVILPAALLITAEIVLVSMVMALFSDLQSLRLTGLLLLFATLALWVLWLTRTLKKHGSLPHKYRSHTDIKLESFHTSLTEVPAHDERLL